MDHKITNEVIKEGPEGGNKGRKPPLILGFKWIVTGYMDE